MVGRNLFLAGFFVVYCAAADEPDGAALFKKHCMICHFKGNTTRAPVPEMLAVQPRQVLADALDQGSMKAQAAGLTAAERKAVVDFVAKPPVAPQPQAAANGCPAPPPAFAALAGWNGWGVDLANTRFQAKAGLTPEQVGNLK